MRWYAEHTTALNININYYATKLCSMRWYAEHTTALNININYYATKLCSMRWYALNINIKYYATKPGCRDLSITCAHIIYSRTLSSLEDNLKVASRGRNM